MSDYISKSAFIEDIKTEIVNLAMDGLKGTPRSREELYQLIERIENQPTLDEKEIIRKPFERVVERLEEFTEQTYYKSVEGDMYAGERNRAYHNAIKILKEECGINE